MNTNTTEKQETMDWKEKIREDYSFLGKPIIDSTIAYWQLRSQYLDKRLQSRAITSFKVVK